MLCLDSVSQVCPASMNFITRSLGKFSGLAKKIDLNLEMLLKHPPKNLAFIHLSQLLLCDVNSNTHPHHSGIT